MDKNLKKEIKEASRQFIGLWTRYVKFGPEDKEQDLKEAASRLSDVLGKLANDNSQG